LVPHAKSRQLHFDLKTNKKIMNTVHVLLLTTEMPDCSNNVTATNSSILLNDRCVNFTTNHSASVSFTDVDGLQPLTLYECVIQLTVNNYTSAKSIPTSIYTPAPTGMNYLHHISIL